MEYISSKNLIKFLEGLQSRYDVIVPIKEGKNIFYGKFDGYAAEDIVIGEVRALEPLKSFFFKAKEVVANNFRAYIPHENDRPVAIVGVKACDLKGFKVQDFVFMEQGVKDPLYTNNRRKNLIISADCTSVIETCFCLAMGVLPYPTAGFDINLSAVAGGFVVEVGSDMGGNLLDVNASLLKKADEEMVDEFKLRRKEIENIIKDNIKRNDVPAQEELSGCVEKNFDADIWKDEAKTCVECGACNTICPTCHCFLLADQKSDTHMERLKLWDSCLIKDFARVAGGHNPRKYLWMRLRNRFDKKFDYFPKVADLYACTGCGRCINACPAKIDIRRVLKRIS